MGGVPKKNKGSHQPLSRSDGSTKNADWFDLRVARNRRRDKIAKASRRKNRKRRKGK